MRAVVQRVRAASVVVDDEIVGSIGTGLCVFVGVTHGDNEETADRMAEKLWRLRIFEDTAGRINCSAAELGLPVLVVSQFSLYADTARGRRPSFAAAATPEQAEPLVECVAQGLEAKGASVARGRFRARMAVEVVNDGPLTVIVDA